jgi:hypothetical protein
VLMNTLVTSIASDQSIADFAMFGYRKRKEQTGKALTPTSWPFKARSARIVRSRFGLRRHNLAL